MDVLRKRFDALNARQFPTIGAELSKYQAYKDLSLSATRALQAALTGAVYIIVWAPINYVEQTTFFDNSSLKAVIAQVKESQPSACIVVKSEIMVGFIEDARDRLQTSGSFVVRFFERVRCLRKFISKSDCCV